MNCFSFRITAIRQETATVETFVQEQEGGEAISYQAGQFLTFLFQVNGEAIRRSFSFSSAPVLPGKVQMHYNEVLTDADEAEGYTLTCTGHPLTDDVVIAV